MKSLDPLLLGVIAIAIALIAAGAWLPPWAQFLVTVALGKGLVALGLMLLLRTGLVSFGQGLFFCLGAYTAGTLNTQLGVTDAFIALSAGTAVAAAIAFVLGFLLAKYRHIFFATLSLAFSMILYGLLVKSSALGSTDGFSLSAPTYFGAKLNTGMSQYLLFSISIALSAILAIVLHRYLQSPLGRLATAIRDNEIRVEYMGASVRYAVHVKYVIAAAFGGLGGALTAITVGHIDPDMAYWTTSGEFVFITVLAGSGHVIAPFLASLIFESVRTVAYEYSPNTWQMVLGLAMLMVIVFFPGGLSSALVRRRTA